MALALSVLLTACGGGGSGDGSLFGGPDSVPADTSSPNGNPLDVPPPDSGDLDTDTDLGIDFGDTTSPPDDDPFDVPGSGADEGIAFAELLLARQTVVGTWAVLIDPATQCGLGATFDAGGRFVAVQLDEILTGRYEVSLENESDVATLSLDLITETDNQLPDCEGDNSSDVGVPFRTYLSFPSEDVMRLSSDPGGSGDILELVRFE